MKSKFLICLCALIASNAWAQVTLDIDSAVAMAIENNLALRRSEMDTASARRRQDRAWNSLIPSLGVSGLLLSNQAAIVDPLNPQQPNGWVPGVSLSASMNITPATFANINQTKLEYEAGRLNYEAARQELEFQVRRLYYQILLLKANWDLALLNIESAQSRHEQTLALQRTGRASSIDELSSRLDVSIQQTNAQNTQAVYHNALDGFKYLLMLPMDETVVLQGDLLGFAVGVHAQDGSSESMQMGLIRQSIAVTEAQQRTARLLSYSPVLTFSWDSAPLYIGEISGVPVPINDWRDSSGRFTIALSFMLDNYLPWSSSKEQDDTLGDAIAKQQNMLTEASINHQNNVQKLLRDIARSEETMETLRLNITLAEETLRMQTDAHRQGAVELQTLNNTRDNLLAAQNRLLSEQYNLLSVILELEKELNIPFGSIARE